jgi:UDP-N-acetylmuramoyl-L-alanyl-D-glutamate--2,6-diaminopimelate ligase
VFIEASSHALKLSKLDAISFDTGIFTNLTPEHLDFHGDMDDYKKSKAKLFSMCENSIINADDSACEYMLSMARANRFTYSTKGREADFMATDIVISKNTENNNKSNCLGINYNLISKNTIMKIKSPLGGAFNVDNTLCAVACAILHGIAPAVISEALASIFGVNGRMERVKLHKNADFSLYIDYAHTPDALQNLLRSARELVFDGGRIILVFGCGGDRDKSKRALMGQIASQNADFVIITSDNSRSEEPSQIIDGIMSGFDKACEHKVIINRREAIEYAVMNAMRGDLILLAGKGHEKYEIDKSGKHPFDEREISIEAARKRFER